MTDSQRILEQNALRSARSLVEMFERDEVLKRKRQTRALWIASVPIVLVLAAVVAPKGEGLADDAKKQRTACELDAWNARAADFERQAREADPGVPYRDVQKRLEHERPFLMAEAKIACNAKAR